MSAVLPGGGYDKRITPANACPQDIADLQRQADTAIAPTCCDH